ncbi:MAG: SRPBCC family protein [Candidatus Caldatribacterium sp.]|nr:SRPBCC family protein [Candidatus Caldatribacterium sp.]MDW8080590.1 SRPBCC family protein [Candidatus Calescibacterium sp.]
MARIAVSLHIPKSAEVVYEKAKDIEALARFLPDLEEVRILKRQGQEVESFWKGKFQGREVRWTERDVWDDANRECRFFALEGDFKRYEGIWRFQEVDPSTTLVNLEIEYDLGIPLVGPLIHAFLKKKMEENALAMLQALKKALEGE